MGERLSVHAERERVEAALLGFVRRRLTDDVVEQHGSLPLWHALGCDFPAGRGACRCGVPARAAATANAQLLVLRELAPSATRPGPTRRDRSRWRAIAAMARPYRDHPDYDTAWDVL